MTIPFFDIAQALEGPRGSGRTRNMLMAAPAHATILVSSRAHLMAVSDLAHGVARHDLRYLIANESNLKGARHGGPFMPDHFTVMNWMQEAARQRELVLELGGKLDTATGRIRNLEAEIARLKKPALQQKKD